MVLVVVTTLTVILVGHAGFVVEEPALSNLSPTEAPIGAGSISGSNGSNGFAGTKGKKVDCIHGEWQQTDMSVPGQCVCDEGWKHAGPSDPMNWVNGVCSQYQCISTSVCNREFPGSTCDVVGWNCNCGWQHASSLLGGDDTKHAKCMGKAFIVSDYACTNTLRLMKWMWKPILAFMILLVFFGEKQVRCECHDPKRFKLVRSLWMMFKTRAGCPVRNSDCPGTCVHRLQWDGRQDWSYEYSWSIYVFDLGLWTYAFLIVFFLTGLVAGSIAAIVVFILAMIIMALCAVIMVICGGDGDGNIGHDACDCHELCGGSSDCYCGDGCCIDAPALGYSSPTMDFFLWGPQPTGSSCDDCHCRDGRCDCCPRLWLCRPLTWVLVRFPERPSNMWGGWIGRMMGTHHFTREERRYQGGNCLIDSFNFRTTADLHSDQGWRQRVHQFVFSDPEPQQMQMTTVVDQRRQQPARRPNLIRHGGTNVAINPRDPWGPFTLDHDRCQRSTFEDYCTGTCWLCREDSRDRFHMWVQCGHIFCSVCSEAMMQRSMPCPLCRKVSTMIVEGPQHSLPYAAPEIAE